MIVRRGEDSWVLASAGDFVSIAWRVTIKV